MLLLPLCAAVYTPSLTPPPLSRVAKAPARTPAPLAQAPLSRDSLLALLSDGLRTSAADQQGEINELLLQLERDNPTEAAAQSTLLNGVWELQYAGSLAPGIIDSPTRELALSIYSSSYSAGVLKELLRKLPFDASLDMVTISIVSLEAKISVLGASRTIRFKCNLQPVSKMRLREVFIEGEMFGMRSLLPGPLSFSRELCVTYLDKDMLVLRDQSGVADVLVRKDAFAGSAEPEGDAPAAS